jgi:hypothetical protein
MFKVFAVLKYVTDIGTFNVDPILRVYDENFKLITGKKEKEAMHAILKSISPFKGIPDAKH